jgi:2-polyprenyl-3-methyl-5-hydroxy-6-metoxy-1,4-benzoquinol methylase
MASSCPACGSAKHKQIDHVDIDQVIRGFASLNVDVAPLFDRREATIELHECEECGLRWYSPMVTGDDAFYESLQQHDWYYQSDKPEYDFAARQVAQGASVLEVGCGRGAFHAYLPKSVRYRGLEFNEIAVRKATEIGLDVAIRPVEEEARERPASYDVVCHFQVLEHVSNPAGFMQASVAALRPGGVMLVTVPAEDSFLRIANAAWLNMPPHHVTRWTDRALTNLYDRLGVNVEDIWHEPVASYHHDWYRSVMVSRGLSSLFGQEPRLQVSGWIPRIAGRLGNVPVVAEWLKRRGESRFDHHRGRGHSVCVVGVRRAT